MALKTYVLAICSISLVVIGQTHKSISLNLSIPICYKSVVEEMNIRYIIIKERIKNKLLRKLFFIVCYLIIVLFLKLSLN